jgi:hypothetical protein
MLLVYRSTPRASMHALFGLLSSSREPNTPRSQQPACSSQTPTSAQASRLPRIAQQSPAAVSSEFRHTTRALLQAAKTQWHGNLPRRQPIGEFSLCSGATGPVVSLQARHQSGGQQHGTVGSVGRRRAAGPNNSLNLRANGMSQSPRHSAGVHFLCRGLCAMPSSPG